MNSKKTKKHLHPTQRMFVRFTTLINRHQTSCRGEPRKCVCGGCVQQRELFPRLKLGLHIFKPIVIVAGVVVVVVTGKWIMRPTEFLFHFRPHGAVVVLGRGCAGEWQRDYKAPLQNEKPKWVTRIGAISRTEPLCPVPRKTFHFLYC